MNWNEINFKVQEVKRLMRAWGALINVACIEPRGCTIGVLIVSRNYKIYIRYGYYLF